MTIRYDILGQPGRDNAMLVTVDTGQSQHRLLFDCGDGCLSTVREGNIQTIEAVFFSHFHIDHVAGFDTLLRMNYSRADGPVRIFGPPGTIEIVQHRLRGYMWNLVSGMPGQWTVTEVTDDALRSSCFLTSEAFTIEHEIQQSPSAEVIYRGEGFTVRAHTLDHGTPCLAFVVNEDDRQNIDTAKLSELGLRPGPWLKTVKDTDTKADTSVNIAGTDHLVGDLRRQMLVNSPGGSIAYVTDFFLATPADEDQLVRFLAGCETVVCENNFRDDDAELARKTWHMTSSDVSRLANRVDPKKLILFHLSDRYTRKKWLEQLEDVRAQFDRAQFPSHWVIEPNEETSD